MLRIKKYCIINYKGEDAEDFLSVLEEFPEYTCIGITETYDSSINLVLKTSPEIIFIDIDSKTSENSRAPFALISELYQFLDYSPTFIALSSSTEKAYDVIKLGFFDYLLKPLKELEIRKSLLRLKKDFKNENPLKICLKSHSDYRFIDITKILYLRADNNCTDFFIKDEAKISGFKTLKHYESLLPKNFLRIHNSFVINTNYLVRINFGKSSIALLGEKEPLPFSRTFKEDVELLRKSLNSLNALQV